MLNSFPQICIMIIATCHCALNSLEGNNFDTLSYIQRKEAQGIHAPTNALFYVENRDTYANLTLSLLIWEEPETSREILRAPILPLNCIRKIQDHKFLISGTLDPGKDPLWVS